MEYFRKHPESGVTSASQIAVVGDRLFTDVMMANLMGGYGFWVKDGIIDQKSFVRCNMCWCTCSTQLILGIVCKSGGSAVRFSVEKRLPCPKPAKRLRMMSTSMTEVIPRLFTHYVFSLCRGVFFQR